MKKICLLFLVFSCIQTSAQSIKKRTSYLKPQLGILNGNQDNSFQFQLLGGIVSKNWQVGMGAGLDYYKVRSVPLFADIRRYFGGDNKVFAFVNAGCNIPWALDKQYKTSFIVGGGTEKSKFEMGWYTDLGVGYDIRLGANRNLSLSLGYSMKTVSERYNESIWVWGNTLPFITERKLDYTFQRLSFKAGFDLW